jgi:outer membrane protein assembly factor BamB
MKRFHLVLLLITGFLTGYSNLHAGDWPMWRYDSGRGSASPDDLPADLKLHWTRQLPNPAPAWPVEQAKLQFDLQAEPVVMGERIFVPSSREDTVTAFSTRTGEELWKFFAEGPVRFAPIASDGRVFFNSDDGFLYALNAESGELIWKVNGGPTQRLIIGNHRLISSWPARGGVVLHDGKLFFAASIWSFMGIFIHAVDPESGEIVWTNSGDGTNWTTQPHSTPSFAGVVPQGHLAAAGGNLVVPGGRSTPAVYDVETGELRHFEFDKRNGGHEVGALGDLYFCGESAYSMENGKAIQAAAPVVFSPETLLGSEGDRVRIFSSEVELKVRESVDRRGEKVRETVAEFEERSETQLDQSIPGSWRIRAGSRFFASGGSAIAAYESGKSAPVWETKLKDGAEVYTMLAGDDRLFVVTENGLLHCFGAGDPEKIATHELKRTAPDQSKLHRDKIAAAKKILGKSPGYVLVLGIDDGSLVRELVEQTTAHVIAIDPDPAKIDRLRREMLIEYGESFAALVGDPAKVSLPPYFCRLITTETPAAAEAFAKNAFAALRPYGGAMILDGQVEGEFESGKWSSEGKFSVLRREGPLPGSDDWTHQYANAAQTVVSKDSLVKAPLGVLWFGGPSHAGILPRHGHGPSPQVAGGRLFIEGPDLLRAVDVYTGSLLWEKDLPGFGQYYNVTAHFAGAGEIGSNYVSLSDRVYAVYGEEILELDSENGEIVRKFRSETPGFFGHISVSGDYLVATAAPVETDDDKGDRKDQILDSGTSVIAQGSNWLYHLGDEAPDDWEKPEFDASEWKTGKAGFGYGDGDDATEIDMRGKFSAVRIRRDFEAEAGTELILRINYDDGFIVWLNGVEILREGVSKSNNDVKSHEAAGYEQFSLKGVTLRPGRNVLAIEGRNTSSGSSDFTLDPSLFTPTAEPEEAEPVETDLPQTRYASGSRRLMVFDRVSGKLLWEREAEFNFRHNNIAVGVDRLFCIDSMTKERASSLARRGIQLKGKPALLALDLRTGKELWKESSQVFGTFLNYSLEHDIVVQASSKYRDRAEDESDRGMIALKGSTGEVVWADKEIKYGGPCLIWKDQILTNGSGGFAINLLTGENSGWDYHRTYGCNTAIGSENLITFRSGAAGFYDLLSHSGTGNLGGFRSSCTNNLIPANGVLNAPDYTRTCSCSYQNQTSLALIHMPEAEFWTYGGKTDDDRIGINFGAPGDRRSNEGTLFFEYPSVSGGERNPPVELDGNVKFTRVHSSALENETNAWIGASSVEGIEKLTIKRPEGVKSSSKCSIRLYFAELGNVAPGERQFDVSVQGSKAISNIDIVKESGGNRVVTRTIEDVDVADGIELLFSSPSARGAALAGIEVRFGSR